MKTSARRSILILAAAALFLTWIRVSRWPRLCLRPAPWSQRFDGSRLINGDRAVAVSVDESQLLNLRDGDHVDLIAVFDANSAQGSDRLAATLIQNVEVLGVDKTDDRPGKGVLQLRLNPTEAQFAALAVRQAEIAVVLRRPGDAELHPMEMSTFRKMFR